MNSNILKENMKRFGTKNLFEQEEVPTDGAAKIDPTDKPKGKVLASKTYSFNGYTGTDRKGNEINNPPYSVKFELISEPSVDASGKVTGATNKVMADGKIIMALTNSGTLYQTFPSNFPDPMKKGLDRIAKWLMGMLASEGKMDYTRLKKGFAEKKLIKDFQGPTPMDLYQNKYPSQYYSYS